jgi:hypothetical protein
MKIANGQQAVRMAARCLKGNALAELKRFEVSARRAEFSERKFGRDREPAVPAPPQSERLGP